MLSLERILINGLLMSLALGVLIFGSMIYNSRLWLQDYPVELRRQVPPNTKQEKRLQIALLVPFLLIMLGIPFVSGLQLKAMNGGALPFLMAYLHVFILLNIGNLFDAAVIDYLVLTVMKPRFMVLPGTEALNYSEYMKAVPQVKNYFKGIIFCTILSLPIAAALML